MPTCKTCGAELAENAKFCPKCGSKIEPKQFCSSCGAELQPNVKFCPKCGSNQLGKIQPATKQAVVQNKEPVQQNTKSVETENISTKERVLSVLPNIFLILVYIGYFLEEFFEHSKSGSCSSVLDGDGLSLVIITLSEICAVITFVLSIISLIKKTSLGKAITITWNLGLLLFLAEIITFIPFRYHPWHFGDDFYVMLAGWLLSSIRIPCGKK